MSKFVLHPEAYSDLYEIWEYIAADNLDAADRVLDEMYAAITSLVRFPNTGHPRPDLTSRRLRFQIVRDYVIAYAPDESPLAFRDSARSQKSARASRDPRSKKLIMATLRQDRAKVWGNLRTQAQVQCPSMRKSLLTSLLIMSVLVAFVGAALIWAARSHRIMLYQHGTPEVPSGRAFAIMNPFRNRRPEEVAEELMADLRTNRCEQILLDLRADDSRICPTMRENRRARLIWREDETRYRTLVYHLPESESNLWITSHRDPQVGFVIDGVSIVR